MIVITSYITKIKKRYFSKFPMESAAMGFGDPNFCEQKFEKPSQIYRRQGAFWTMITRIFVSKINKIFHKGRNFEKSKVTISFK